MVSATAFTIALYSASALDRDDVVWRLDDRETNEEPKNTQYPEVDLRVLGVATPIGVRVCSKR